MATTIGLTAACQVLGVSRSGCYRHPRSRPSPRGAPRLAPSPRALRGDETAPVRQLLESARFQDCPPREVYAPLLDEGTYVCSWPTLYRMLRDQEEVRERRNQLHHPAYAQPERLATGPHQLWSWDIPKLRSPATWTYYD